MVNWQVHRSFIILVAIVTAIGLLGVLDSFGYGLSFKIFGGITVSHILAAAQAYIVYVMWKKYV